MSGPAPTPTPPQPAPDTRVLDRIERARADALYRRLPVAQATVIVNGAVVVVVLGAAAGWPGLLGWLAVVGAVVALRLAWWWRRRSRGEDDPPARWTRRFLVGALANGLCWGALVPLTWERIGTPERMFVATVIVGMCAGAASSTSGHVGAFLAFTLAALLPLVGRALVGDSPLEVAVGLMGCGFAGAMWALARDRERALTGSLTLQFRNESLVTQLSAARERLTAINAQLEERIRERTAELVELERQLSRSALLASVGSLSAAIAHDLNSPLASLLGNLGVIEQELAEAAAAGAATPMSREALEDVRACADRVRLIVRSLGDVARGDGPPGPLSLQDVVDACVTVATPELRTRAQVVRDYGPPVTVRADRATLTQALLALLLRVGRGDPGPDGPAREIRIRTRLGDAPGTAVVEFLRVGSAPVGDEAQLERPQDFPLSLTHAAVARLGGRVTPVAHGDRLGLALALPLAE